ncbi:response regulator transcription factor [Glaciihabitans tibetensis]|nr:response regulator transcription factor [Glaciihabitans tibetensis]
MDTGGETRVAVIIEDDDDIRHLLDTVLTQAGFQVIATSNGQDGIDAVRRYEPVVTTLDVNMPGMDGFEAARRIRAFSSTYIVMLTALSEEIDTLQGLDAGADDYINKPFRPRELRARIEAMLRRPRMVGDAASVPPVAAPAVALVAAPGLASPVVPAPVTAEPLAAPIAAAPAYAPAAADPIYSPAAAPTEARPAAPVAPPVAPSTALEPFNPAATPAGSGWMEHNDLWLNIETRVVKVGPKEIDLTRSEFDLLAALMESTRRVRTKADLALLLRGESYVTSHFIGEADKRAIEVHMGNLRKKLSDSIASPRWIETVRGVGYRLTAVDSD